MEKHLQRIVELVGRVDLRTVEPTLAAIVEQIGFHAGQALEAQQEFTAILEALANEISSDKRPDGPYIPYDDEKKEG